VLVVEREQHCRWLLEGQRRFLRLWGDVGSKDAPTAASGIEANCVIVLRKNPRDAIHSAKPEAL